MWCRCLQAKSCPGRSSRVRKLLLLEDDTLFAQTLEDFLEEEGFEVTVTGDGALAYALATEERFDLLLLDINVPQIDGIELLKRLRKAQQDRPALFITSYREKSVLAAAFEAGGDDFLSKPVDLEELRLRIGALLRRNASLPSEIPLGCDLLFDPVHLRLLGPQGEITLPKKCIDLLALLATHQGKTVTAAMIETALYDYGETPSSGAIRVYVNQIKKLLGPHRVTNLRGIGYRLEKE